MKIGPVLVTLPTGTQGSAVANALLEAGVPVIAYVRSANSAGAHALANKGAQIVVGELDDRPVLEAAMQGVQGVFSVQVVGMDDDPGLEMRNGRAVIEAAARASVPMLVHSSVARAGDHRDFQGWSEGRWWNRYWEDKAALNSLVREIGLPRWCILKPAVMMENHLPPKVDGMAPYLRQGRIVTAMKPNTRLDIVAAHDIGAFALAAFSDPERFAGQEIDLAGESLTMTEIASIYSEITGRTITAEHLSEPEARGRLHKMVVDGNLWDDVEGYRVDIPAAGRWGIPLTSLSAWASTNQDELKRVVGAV